MKYKSLRHYIYNTCHEIYIVQYTCIKYIKRVRIMCFINTYTDGVAEALSPHVPIPW